MSTADPWIRVLAMQRSNPRLRKPIERVQQRLCLVYGTIGCRKSVAELITAHIDLTVNGDE